MLQQLSLAGSPAQGRVPKARHYQAGLRPGELNGQPTRIRMANQDGQFCGAAVH